MMNNRNQISIAAAYLVQYVKKPMANVAVISDYLFHKENYTCQSQLL